MITLSQEIELQGRISDVINANTDPHTTDADIRFFETQSFMEENGLTDEDMGWK